ncbi:MAG: glycosyltransferase [Opitutales bacterium]|nr:glycosyltransferase [Opitutales bacterium]
MNIDPKKKQLPTDSCVSQSKAAGRGQIALSLSSVSCSADALSQSIQSLQKQTWRDWILFVDCPEAEVQDIAELIESDERIRLQKVDAEEWAQSSAFVSGVLLAGVEWKHTELEECVWTFASCSGIGWIEGGGMLLAREYIFRAFPKELPLDFELVSQWLGEAGASLDCKGWKRGVEAARDLDLILAKDSAVDNNARAMEEFPDSLPLENSIMDPGKRLLLFVPSMRLGGADRFNLNLIDQLQNRGWRVTVLATDNDVHSWRDAFVESADEVFALSEFVVSSWMPVALNYFINSRKPELAMIAGSEKAYWFLPYLRSCNPGLPIVDYSHIEEDYWKHGGIPRYAGRSSALLNLNLVSSERLKSYLLDQFNVADKSVQVVTTNIDTDYWSPDPGERNKLRSDLDVDTNTNVVLFAGRICAQKQPKVLAEAMHKVLKDSTDVEFWIAGDGDDRAWLEGFVQKQELQDRVRFFGSIPPDRIRAYFRAADIFFLPSLWEGIALALYEAMSIGMVVLASDVGGQKELVVEGTGYLIQRNHKDPSAEADEYARILLQLIHEPDTRKAVGEMARQRVCKSYPFNDLGRRLEAAFDRASEVSVSPGIERAVSYEIAIRAVEYFRLTAFLEDKELSYRSWFAKLQEKARWLQAERNAIEDELQSLQEYTESFKQQCKLLEEAKEWLEAQNRSMQLFIDEQRDAHDREKQGLQKHIDQLQSGVDWQAEQIKQMEALNVELQAGNEWLAEQTKQLEVRNAELQSGNEWQSQQLAELGAHAEELRLGIEFYKNERDKWEQDAQALKAELYRRKNWWKIWRRWQKEVRND